MKPMKMLFKAVTCLATLAVVSAGCDGVGDYFQNKNALDGDRDGLCDICENSVPPLPLELSPLEAPLDLQIEVSLAEGISPPANGRIALITYLNPGFIEELPLYTPSVALKGGRLSL